MCHDPRLCLFGKDVEIKSLNKVIFLEYDTCKIVEYRLTLQIQYGYNEISKS